MPRPRGTKQQREAEQRLAVGKGKLIVVNLSGRGDKDVQQAAELLLKGQP